VAVAIGSHSTWRWIFYLNIILTTISLILITLFFNPVSWIKRTMTSFALTQRKPTKLEALEPHVWKKPVSWKRVDMISMLLMNASVNRSAADAQRNTV
jgi:MFS family permease